MRERVSLFAEGAGSADGSALEAGAAALKIKGRASMSKVRRISTTAG
jgi:hypothetical protein